MSNPVSSDNFPTPPNQASVPALQKSGISVPKGTPEEDFRNTTDPSVKRALAKLRDSGGALPKGSELEGELDTSMKQAAASLMHQGISPEDSVNSSDGSTSKKGKSMGAGDSIKPAARATGQLPSSPMADIPPQTIAALAQTYVPYSLTSLSHLEPSLIKSSSASFLAEIGPIAPAESPHAMSKHDMSKSPGDPHKGGHTFQQGREFKPETPPNPLQRPSSVKVPQSPFSTYLAQSGAQEKPNAPTAGVKQPQTAPPAGGGENTTGQEQPLSGAPNSASTQQGREFKPETPPNPLQRPASAQVPQSPFSTYLAQSGAQEKPNAPTAGEKMPRTAPPVRSRENTTGQIQPSSGAPNSPSTTPGSSTADYRQVQRSNPVDRPLARAPIQDVSNLVPRQSAPLIASAAGTAPSSAGKTPSSAGTAPSSAGKTPSSAGKAPSSAGTAPSSAGKAPSSAPSPQANIPSFPKAGRDVQGEEADDQELGTARQALRKAPKKEEESELITSPKDAGDNVTGPAGGQLAAPGATLDAGPSQVQQPTATERAETAQQIISQMVDQISQIRSSDRTETTVTLNQPPQFQGVQVIVTELDSARKELNLTFANVQSPEAQAWLAENRNVRTLNNSLNDLGFVVHQVDITHQQDLRVVSQDPSSFGQQSGQSDQDSHQQRQQQGEKPRYFAQDDAPFRDS